jgi:hypothetical protein
VHSRPRVVPPGTGDLTGNDEFDRRYLVGGEDVVRTFPTGVAEVFLAAPERPFALVSLSGNRVCAHSTYPPGSRDTGTRLVDFAVAVSRAYD